MDANQNDIFPNDISQMINDVTQNDTSQDDIFPNDISQNDKCQNNKTQ
jgi:hypothetical protein